MAARMPKWPIRVTGAPPARRHIPQPVRWSAAPDNCQIDADGFQPFLLIATEALAQAHQQDLARFKLATCNSPPCEVEMIFGEIKGAQCPITNHLEVTQAQFQDRMSLR